MRLTVSGLVISALFGGNHEVSILAYHLERLPVGSNYNLYAEALVGIAVPSDFEVPADLCSQDVRMLEWRKAHEEI
jgi:hypothetical protein